MHTKFRNYFTKQNRRHSLTPPFRRMPHRFPAFTIPHVLLCGFAWSVVILLALYMSVAVGFAIQDGWQSAMMPPRTLMSIARNDTPFRGEVCLLVLYVCKHLYRAKLNPLPKRLEVLQRNIKTLQIFMLAKMANGEVPDKYARSLNLLLWNMVNSVDVSTGSAEWGAGEWVVHYPKIMRMQEENLELFIDDYPDLLPLLEPWWIGADHDSA